MGKVTPKINWFNFFLVLFVAIAVGFIVTALVSGLLALAWNGFAVSAFGLRAITWETAFWGVVLFDIMVIAIKILRRR